MSLSNYQRLWEVLYGHVLWHLFRTGHLFRGGLMILIETTPSWAQDIGTPRCIGSVPIDIHFWAFFCGCVLMILIETTPKLSPRHRNSTLYRICSHRHSFLGFFLWLCTDDPNSNYSKLSPRHRNSTLYRICSHRHSFLGFFLWLCTDDPNWNYSKLSPRQRPVP